MSWQVQLSCIYPLSIVNHIGLKRYSSVLQPLFKVTLCNTINKESIKIYDVEKLVALKLLWTNEGTVTIKSNMWISSNNIYMAIIANYTLILL